MAQNMDIGQQAASESESNEASVEGRRESRNVLVIYTWKGKKHTVNANPDETIIDIMKENHGIRMNRRTYLMISAREPEAVINPWVPFGALTREGTLKITRRNFQPPEPSVFHNFSDLKCFLVNGTYWEVHNLYSDRKPLIVYGHKNESIRKALERDTRFDDIFERINQGQKSYLYVYSQILSAELYSSVPCGALEDGEELTVSIRQGRSPEPTQYPYTDGMFFKVKNIDQRLLPEGHCYVKKQQAVYGNKHKSIRKALKKDKRFNITMEFALRSPGEPEHKNWAPLSQLKQEHCYVISYRDTEVRHSSYTNSITVDPDNRCGALHSPTSTRFSNDFNELPEEVKTEALRKSAQNYKDSSNGGLSELYELCGKHKRNVGLICNKSYNDGFLWGGNVILLTEDLALTSRYAIESLENSLDTEIFDIIFTYDKTPLINKQYSAQAEVLFLPEDEHQDFAFLTIHKNKSSFNDPEPGLLSYVARPPTEGAVSIISYLGGRSVIGDTVRSVISSEREGTMNSLTDYKRADARRSVIIYKCCNDGITSPILSDETFLHFYKVPSATLRQRSGRMYIITDSCRSSGSPIFDNAGKLVAMHTGGYLAETEQEKTVIEYGRSICDIIKYGMKNCKRLRQQLGEEFCLKGIDFEDLLDLEEDD